MHAGWLARNRQGTPVGSAIHQPSSACRHTGTTRATVRAYLPRPGLTLSSPWAPRNSCRAPSFSREIWVGEPSCASPLAAASSACVQLQLAVPILRLSLARSSLLWLRHLHSCHAQRSPKLVALQPDSAHWVPLRQPSSRNSQGHIANQCGADRATMKLEISASTTCCFTKGQGRAGCESSDNHCDVPCRWDALGLRC